MRGAALAVAALAFAAASAARAEALTGAQIFLRPDKGNCAACHQVSDPAAPKTRSDLGPRLEGARMRSIGRERLRALLTDPMAGNPETLMPPYGRHRILDASQIDRVLDYLDALP
ncbi:MAG TPA: sulfur oxidation c-type cytochrome SoxX [Usitatibacter sp.]|nr:sulfur oxidation c-type cytochrome SoxX [Usitatibacter sp.]